MLCRRDWRRDSVPTGYRFRCTSSTASWGVVHLWWLWDDGGSSYEFLLSRAGRTSGEAVCWRLGLHQTTQGVSYGGSRGSSVEDCTCCHERCEEDEFQGTDWWKVSYYIGLYCVCTVSETVRNFYGAVWVKFREIYNRVQLSKNKLGAPRRFSRPLINGRAIVIRCRLFVRL